MTCISATLELPTWKRYPNREVDFIVRVGRHLTAIEVTSGRTREARAGMAAFAEAFKPARALLVGGDGTAVDEFLAQPVEHWVAH